MNSLGELQRLLGIGGEKLAEILGTTASAIQDWQSGKVEPDPSTKKTLSNMLRVVSEVRRFVPPQEVVRWLTTPDPDFHGQLPLDLPGSDFATRILSDSLRHTPGGIG